MASPYRPEFEAALRLFARVSEAMVARGLSRPVLVGGAAAEYYSASAVTTGDFDICTPWDQALGEELQRAGFVRPTGVGQLSRGWIHPDLDLGLEIVASIPMDGNVDGEHVLLVEDVGDGTSFAIIAVEDLIADRMGQYASGTARDRLDQAQILFALHPAVDRDYLDRRIKQETAGEYGLEALKG